MLAEVQSIGQTSRELAAFRWAGAARSVEAAQPVSFGISLPRTAPSTAESCCLESPDGMLLPAQTEVLGRWHHGATRWLLVDAILPAGTRLEDTWKLVASPCFDDAAAHVFVNESKEYIRIAGGKFTSKFRRDGLWTLLDSNANGSDSEPTHHQSEQRGIAQAELPRLIDQKGRSHSPRVESIHTLAAGPIRATIEFTASYPRLRGLRVVARWSFFAGLEISAIEITVHNPRRARHAGGLWDLGDSGSILFRDLSLALELAGKPVAAHYCCETGGKWEEAESGEVEIHQESSGGVNWNSLNHVNRNGDVPLAFCGFRGRSGQRQFAGSRAMPIVALAADSTRVTATIDEFWQQFPKAINVANGAINLRLFPQQFGDLHELQGGEQKTHHIRVAFSAGSRTRVCTPVDLRAITPRLLSGSIDLPGLPLWEEADPTVLKRLDALAEEFLTGPRGFFANRERVDDYGWRNYGDIHADHEELHYHGPQPLVSHYNNQFDFVCGALLQFLRTGDGRWLEIADPLARHVCDIDIYHTTEDRAAYSGGLFWFTDHYLHAQTSTHRTYSRSNRHANQEEYGGGPASSHNFTTGLLFYHLLTGYLPARQAVISLADWVIAMDDGSRTLLGLVDDGPTGLASATGERDFQGPARGTGNSVNAVLDAWLLTSDRRYLNCADTLIRRCVHPNDDIASLQLLHAEKRWSYTVFLASLAKYLQCKAELCEDDQMFGYGMECLQHYGRWMLRHERPYLDRRAELEFPTEAWAAQELRKANVLRMVARCAPDSIRQSMFDRGDELAERAWNDLQSFSTRATARAMAIVLVEGLRDAELRLRPALTFRSAPARSYGNPERFRPQRERVKAKLRSPAGIMSLAISAANPLRWPRIFQAP